MNGGERSLVSAPELKIVVPAMALGVIVLNAVAVTIGPLFQSGPEASHGPPVNLLLALLAGVSVLELAGYVTLRQIVTARARAQCAEAGPDDDLMRHILPSFRTLTLVGAALAESIGLFAGVIFLLTGERAALVATAVSLALLIKQFPTQGRLIDHAARITGGVA